MQLQVKWRSGAYLTVAGQWVCLSVDPIKFEQAADQCDYNHIARRILRFSASN